jgi:glycosyltransferase involved in cell wall biosynthesis
LIDFGLSGERVLVLSNCVSTKNTVEASPHKDPFGEFGFSKDNLLFGNVGNIRRVKNQLLFVRALSKVIAVHPQVRGLIVGETLEGEEQTRTAIESEISRLGMSGKIVLTGFRSDVDDLMPGLAALCMTSDSEGMPNVVLEAMASGVPVVATAVGGVPDAVRDGETGHLVARGNASAYSGALLQIVEQPGFAQRMAAAARSWVANERSCSAMARRLEEAYLKALGEPRA